MEERQASLEDFYKWYEADKVNLLHSAIQQKEKNGRLRKEFIGEWPLDRILTMSIDEYVIGKGPQNVSFCYLIEKGKYKDLFIGISGGAASKFGIYWSKNQEAYKDYANRIIPDSELEVRFARLKSDLHKILQAGIQLDFENTVFNMKQTENQFSRRSAMIIKLLCIYSEDCPYFGVNNNSHKEFWNKLLPQRNQGGPYLQNHAIYELISEKYPELDGSTLGSIIYEYSKLFTEDNVKATNNEFTMENSPQLELSKTLRVSKNIILRGAPGTGKTYLAKEIAKELTDGNEDQIAFVQFHPSYDYTDFVEGLRPLPSDDGQISFGLQDGIFKKFCERAKLTQKTGGQDNFEEVWESYLEFINTTEEKEYLTKTSYLSVNSRQNLSVNYDSGGSGWTLPRHYVYELYKNKNYDKQRYYKSGGKTVLKVLKERFALKTYKEAAEISSIKNFVFIIDEINRGEISKIFGELFFSIDPSYRGRKGEVSTQYTNLHKNDGKFYIPENVYIIGTMNDIDRSVDTFDFAMRRRFRFVEITAESQLGMLDEALGDGADEAKSRLLRLNQAISQIEGLSSHYHIGPSYFLALKDLEFNYDLLWSDYLKPLLEDYLRGTYDEDEKLAELKAAYDNESKVEADATD